jgi:uncharacterized protein
VGFLLEVLVLVGIVVGLVGTVIPVLPGLVLVWGSILVWALLDGGGWVRWTVAVLCTGLMVAGYVLGTVLPGRRANEAGAPGVVVLGGVVGMVLGFFFIPVVGLVVGGVAGVFLAELVRSLDLRSAWRLTLETLKGFGIAAAVQLGCGLLMTGLWAAAVVVT